ncbi:MAG: helix-turn-helix domain-containing protein [Clostridiales bacterium]|nr:helix-turn-helix domain-containing protein [Clostridiales bacterium]
MKPLYSCEYVANRYGVKKITVWDWIRSGKLKAMKIGKMYRVSEEHLAEFEAAAKRTES